MSEMTEPNEWVWQGFFGPMAAAAAAKLSTDADSRVGVWVPLPDEPPQRVDRNGTMGMFAVQTRRSNPVETPLGVLEADPAMVGRMIGA
jgi:hypothetical protein